MGKRTVIDILEDVMGDDAVEIYEKELKRLHMKSIIDAPIDVKHQFVQNILTHHLDFSSEKTAGVYHDLLDALGIAPRVVLLDEYLHKEKGPHDKILDALEEFWEAVYQYLVDYEVILNLYWKKGAQAVIDRVEYKKVVKVTGDAFIFSREKLEDAYRRLRAQLRLTQVPVHHTPHKEIFTLLNQTFKENVEQEKDAHKRLAHRIENFWDRVLHMVKELEELFAVSLDEEIQLLKKESVDMSLIEALQTEVQEHWRRLSNHYEALRLDIQEDDLEDLEL